MIWLVLRPQHQVNWVVDFNFQVRHLWTSPKQKLIVARKLLFCFGMLTVVSYSVCNQEKNYQFMKNFYPKSSFVCWWRSLLIRPMSFGSRGFNELTRNIHWVFQEKSFNVHIFLLCSFFDCAQTSELIL